MKKDQVVILEKRGAVLISGNDADYFLQNIITNDIKKVSNENSIFAALLTPQGKYLNDFAINDNKRSSKFYRIINEVPTIILIVVVFVVVFKPLY